MSSCNIYERYVGYTDLNKPIISKKTDSVFKGDYEIYSTPNKEVQTKIIQTINDAEKTIDLSIYLLTSEPIISAIVNAHTRGVGIKVLLEKSVYQLPKINHPAYNFLQSKGIDVRWSSETDINFNHSKYMIIDDVLVVIGTGNFSQSTFVTNRDFFIFLTDLNIIQELNSIFERDFNEIKTSYSGSAIIVSPDNAEKQIEHHIRSAKNSIQVFAPSLEDEGLIKLIKDKTSNGVKVIICTPEKNRVVTEKILSQLPTDNKVLYWSKNPFTHAKTILVDNKNLLIGSLNFTSNSLNNNREIGIILPILQNLDLYQNIFQSDCKR